MKTFIFVLLASLIANAQTVVKQREKELERLIQLERLTFGPEDNFQGSRSPQNNEILLTKKTHLTPSLERLDLSTRQKTDLGPQYNAAEEVQFNSNNQFLFRSTRQRADGEICWQSRYDSSPKCFSAGTGEKQFPFWLGTNQIGYVLKNRVGSQGELKIFATGSGSEKTVMSGNLLHPDGSPSGDEIVLVERKGNENRLVTFNVNTAKRCDGRLAWPGSFAFPSYSMDGSQIVFSYYPTDSNNDGRIDVSDRSIIAKVSAKSVCDGGEMMPEALTSLEKNCGHAYLSSHLDMTCAFEGSLDLYQAPTTGLIPASWTTKELMRAHAAARSPEERLFVLWTLQKKYPEQLSNLSSRLFVQFLIMRDDVASLAWLEKAQAELKYSEAQKKVWVAALTAGQARKSEPPGEITISLRSRLEKLLSDASRGGTSLSTLAQARINRILGGNNVARARNGLMTVVKTKASSYPEFLLAALEWDELASAKPMPEFDFMNYIRINFPESSTDTLPFWVRSLERLEGNSDRRKLILAMIEKLGKDTPARTLLEMEILAMNVAEGAKNAYLEFDKRNQQLRPHQQLARFAGYRAIRLWTKADKLQEVVWIATNLLRFFENPSLEWTAARDYYIATEFDRAYESESKNLPAKALGHFLGGATATDDLEAHWGYLRNKAAINEDEDISKYVGNLVRRKQTDVLAGRIQAMSELVVIRNPLTAEQIDQFLARFDREPGGNHPISLFLQGSLRLEKLMLKPWTGSDEQLKESEKTHRDLTVALDGAIDNERLKAAVLNNMALLYSHTRQWGSAERAWSQRAKYPFAVKTDEPIASWFRAQALFHLADFISASQVLERFELKDVSPEWQFPFFHRKAFYATLAQNSSVALKAAETAQSVGKTETKENQRELRFLKARALWALKKNSEAYTEFANLMQDLDSDKDVPGLKDRPSGNHPHRMKILATGFLVQLADKDADKKAWIERRLALMDITVDLAKSLAIPSDALYESKLKNSLHLMELGAADSPRIKTVMEELDLYRIEAGLVASVPWFETLQGMMVLSLSGKLKLTPGERAEVIKRVDQFNDSASKLPYPSPLLAMQQVHLRSTKYAFEKGGDLKLADKAFFDKLLTSDLLTKLKGESPALGQKATEWVKFVGDQTVK